MREYLIFKGLFIIFLFNQWLALLRCDAFVSVVMQCFASRVCQICAVGILRLSARDVRERSLDCFTMLASVIVCFAVAPRNVNKKAMHY